MKNKLFLVCPTVNLEPFIRRHYGEASFFLTALGGVFRFGNIAYAETLKDFLERENIRELVLVQDAACPFMQRVLQRQTGTGTAAEQVLLDLVIDHYTAVTQSSCLQEQTRLLAQLNLQRQAEEILVHEILLSQFARGKLLLKGLFTNQASNQISEIDLIPNYLLHELALVA